MPPVFIFFDAGFTVLRPHPSVGGAYAAHLAEFGVTADAAAIERHFRDAWKARRAAYGGKGHGPTDADAREFWYPIVNDTLARAGVSAPSDPQFLPSLFDAFGTARYWQLFEDVRPALDLAKSRGAGIGVLSNFDSRLHRALAELGIGHELSPIVLSSEVGAEKPDPAIFAAAERALPAQWRGAKLALIGDEPTSDGDGAMSCGWTRCLIDRARRLDRTCAHPVANTLLAAVESVLEQTAR